ncbi:MAG: hypothetical protein ACM3U2_15040 [Deltaproteobacteria bacterium]
MRLYRPAEVPEDEQGLLCRQSRRAGVVRLIIWCGVLAIPVVSGWNLDKPWLLWMFVALAAVVIPMAVLELAAIYRATNWLLRIGRDGVWINLRSYKDRDIGDAPSVVRLDYGEIACVGRYTESYTTPSQPSSDASTVWRDEFLEIELTHDQTEELRAALNDLHFPPAAQPPSGHVRVRGRVSPVWFVNPSLLRIGWVSGHGHAVLPRLAQALSRLETYVRVAPPTRRERPNWRKLTPEDATDLARELIHVHGDTFAAADLLSRACGITYGEAGAQVQQFEEEGIV